MNILLLSPILIGFLSALIFIPYWLRKSKEINYLWRDMNKFNNPKNVAGSGGLIVILSFVLGVLYYLFIRTFVFEAENGIITKIFVLLAVILIFAILGFIDDFLGWERGGLSIKFRLFLAFFASIPLIVVNAGDSEMFIPFFGAINFGLLYPLLFVPIGVAGAATTYNFLAGFNGLETGQGIIILTFLSFISFITGSSWLALIGLIMVASLIAFYFYNKYPAKVFPGDILTYSIGGLIAVMAIFGNFEKIAIFVFIPYILEVFLKLRGRLKKQSFAIPGKDGSLEMPYNKIYGLTHLSLFVIKKFKKKVYEKDVTYLIFVFQIILCLSALIIFRGELF
ncbi:MAG: glycosyl transferase family 4 [Nanoarchaeota archaeon]|nr:glycosyl transferase family 4 [Nanoarchaeota archaeon]